MSERATRWVINHVEQPPPVRLVLFSLAFNSTVDGAGRMRIKTVARHTGLDSESVERALRIMDAAGVIRHDRAEARRRAFTYEIAIPAEYRPELRLPHTDR